MSAYYYGEATLPDGRKVYGRVYVIPDGPGPLEEVTGVDMYWSHNDEPLTADEYNEDSIQGQFLHGYVTYAILDNGEHEWNLPEPSP